MELKFKNILVPFDTSKSAHRALEMAMIFAKKCNSQITMVHVVVSDARDQSEKVKEIMKEKEEASGLEFLFLKTKGRIHTAILEAGESVEADLIVMGTHGASGMQEFWIGSNAFRVVSSASIPVITIREDVEELTLDNLFLPIDDFKDTRQKVPVGIGMAKLLGAKIHIFETSKYTADDTVERLRRYGDQVAELIEAEEVETVRAAQLGGDVSDNVIDYAATHGSGIIIMMSESESARGIFLGSNATAVGKSFSVSCDDLASQRCFKYCSWILIQRRILFFL